MTFQPPYTAGQTTKSASLPVTFASDQTPAAIPTATTMQNAATANGNGSTLSVSGYAVAILNVVSSVALSGGTTINFEKSVDGTTWVSALGVPVGGTTSPSPTTTADGDFHLNVAGYSVVRARISSYSAGTTTVKGYASPIGGPLAVAGCIEQYAPVYEDNAVGVAKVEQRFSPVLITTAATSVVKASAGMLHTLVFTGGTAGTVIGYDNASAGSGTQLFNYSSTNARGTDVYDCTFANGLTIVTSAATNLTVNFR